MKKMLFLPVVVSALSAAAQSLTPQRLGLRLPETASCTPVKNQAMSSTCWSFAGCSFLESEMKRLGSEVPDLSEMYIARFSYINKIETHLRQQGKNYFTPGGQFHDILRVLKTRGIMPQQTYPGRAGDGEYNHSELDTALQRYVNSLVAAGITTPAREHYQYIDSVLNRHLGIVISNFTWKNRNFTPQAFLKAVVQLNPDDYVEITSFTHHPFYTRFVLEDKYNWSGDLYYNVPVADLSAIAAYALRNGFTLCWDGDVTEPAFDFGAGLAWLPFKGGNWQAERQRTLENGTTTIDHLMHITGTAKDKDGKLWYCVKNSWGTGNPLGGFMFMSDAYFKIKTCAIIVHKDAIPAAIRKKMGILP